MNKIKVLHFPLANSKGGVTQFELRLLRNIDQEKFHLDFATVSKHIDFEDELQAAGAKLFYISCYAEDDPEQFSAEFHRILDEGYDVVHLHTSCWKGMLAEKICMQRNVPKVIIHSHATSVHGTKNPEALTEVHERNKKKIDSSIATDFWACSQPAADWLFGNRIPRNRIVVLHNGIETEAYQFDGAKRKVLRTRYHLADKIVLGCVANFTYQKNHSFLMNLFTKLDERYVLLLIGKGMFLEDVKQEVHAKALESRVLFLGYMNNAADFYNAMDCFVLPSIAEAFPYVSVEAQTNGLPCLVSTNVPKEIDFTPNIQHLDLQQEVWMHALYGIGIRRDFHDYVVEAIKNHLDVQSTVKRVEELYLAK